MGDVLVIAHAVAALVLLGLTLTVAVVVYPGFAEVGASTDPAGWRRFHAAHSRRMAFAVGPAWAVEGLAVAGLLIERPPGVSLGLVLTAAAAGAATVGLTVLRAVPLHQRMSGGYDPAVLRSLLRAHLWRSLAWVVAAGAGIIMALEL